MATIIPDVKDLNPPTTEADTGSFQGGNASSREWMLSHFNARDGHPSISADQLTSLSALISYIAVQSGQSEFRIERNLSDMFNVANAKWLRADQVDQAIRYLVDALPQ